MNAKTPYSPSRNAPAAVAAFLSVVIAIGILGSVTGLFQSRGLPMGELAAAARACVKQAFVSERESCMREWVAAQRGSQVAKR